MQEVCLFCHNYVTYPGCPIWTGSESNRFGEKCCSGAGGLIPPLWFVTRQMHNFSCDDGSASILLTEAMLDLLIAVAD